ncbi:MAG: hypothetical protein Q8L01_00760 [Candidatus Woesebacteria bacterium]|nr:hypothetical protein [Candidatus Woesebacteria bacterium]
MRHPNSKTNEPKFWQILSSPKNSFAKTSSALKPHALPEYLEGRTPKEKYPFLFQEKIHHRQIRNARSVFSFGVAGVLASAWGFLRAYDSVSLHHARGACEVITSLCFGNRCEFGTINTPEWNLLVENQPWRGRADGTPTLFRPFSPMNSPMNSDSRLRRDGGFFRQETGAKSEAILTHSICLIQKEFLLL